MIRKLMAMGKEDCSILPKSTTETQNDPVQQANESSSYNEISQERDQSSSSQSSEEVQQNDLFNLKPLQEKKTKASHFRFMFQNQKQALKTDEKPNEENQSPQKQHIQQENQEMKIQIKLENREPLSTQNPSNTAKPSKIQELQQYLNKPIQELAQATPKNQLSKQIRKRENKKKAYLLEKRYKQYKYGKKKDQLTNTVFNSIEQFFMESD